MERIISLLVVLVKIVAKLGINSLGTPLAALKGAAAGTILLASVTTLAHCPIFR
jgi:hypothetical protein